MGVTYKLRDEVVQFIISQRRSDSLSSCRQLAELASQKFGVHLSKSSVHDVLKESGIISPRGRKPRSKFKIPQEKKQQIQVSLSKVNLLTAPDQSQPEHGDTSIPGGGPVVPIAEPIIPNVEPAIPIAKPVIPKAEPAIPVAEQVIPKVPAIPVLEPVILSPRLEHSGVNCAKDLKTSFPSMEISSNYQGAGRIFLKAVIWDLGMIPDQTDFPRLQETDWNYFLTYCKGIKVVLENSKDFFIDLPLPLERCIREAADGLINNIRPLIVHKVSDQTLFKASMEAQSGFRINSISIVGQDDHIMLELNNIVEYNRIFSLKSRVFVETSEKNVLVRAKTAFFSQHADNNNVIDNILNLQGFDTTNKDENIVTILIDDSYDYKSILQEATDKLNEMYLLDEANRSVRVKIQIIPPPNAGEKPLQMRGA